MDKFNIILEKLLNERLPTSQIDPTKFPNPFRGDPDKFLSKGKRDGRESDDKIQASKVSLSVKQLKPSQDAIYLSKALSMAVGGIAGGDLGAVISSDNYILDGHHRYASTMFNNPSANVQGIQVDLEIGDLIPVLRAVGDALRNKRGTAPKSGGTSVFNATINDVKEAIYEGKDMNPQFYNREEAIAWFESKGEETIETRLGMIKKKLPPSGAPQRKNMPRIHPRQLNYLVNIMQGGKVDVVEPYANEQQILKLKDLIHVK